jgi:hypothetical protein
MSSYQQRLRRRACERQRSLCVYCQHPMWSQHWEEFARLHGYSVRVARRFQCTAEHLLPVSEGGSTTPENIVACCRFCNENRHRTQRALSSACYAVHVERCMSAGRWHPRPARRREA